jgi:hypothetical protein
MKAIKNVLFFSTGTILHIMIIVQSGFSCMNFFIHVEAEE